ncbi:GroES-like protein [Aspergillus pseudoustus]|uniref:GroES-like protein n=1 Tax=Aspergillus pseudoustus TaxID=1810923 RepID=A0ABR4JUL2_9EURO
MSLLPNKSIYATEDAQFIVRNDIHHDDLEYNELLIETHYSGVNPADIRHSTLLGIRSTVVGYDFAGRVISSPPGSKYKEGDIVAGYTPSGLGRPTKYGAHQDYLTVPQDDIFKVPPNLPKAHAAALAVVVMTAADAIYNLFKTPLPTTDPGFITAPILIWGASSSVGISAIQLARAGGHKNIFVTASPGRHALLKDLGATQAFDYSSPTVIEEIKSAVASLGEGPITHGLDAVGSMSSPCSSSSAHLLAQAVSDSAVLASVVLRPGTKFQMPVAAIKDGWSIHPPGAPGPVSFPTAPTRHQNAWKALLWAVDYYGTKFRFPVVEVFYVTPEEAVGELVKVAEGKRGFGKVVLKHPFR